MNQVEVEIIGMAITARYGTLQTGTILRTDEAYAKHLVEDCGAAKYRTPVESTRHLDIDVVQTPAKSRKKVVTVEDAPAVPAADPAADPTA